MKQVLLKEGAAFVEDVPAPQVEPGTILVHVDHSCISVGTEMHGLHLTGVPLWRRALQQPQKVKRVAEMVVAEGWSRTRAVVSQQVAAALPVGYSAAGIIVDVGEGVHDLQVGQRVACAGAQCAHHAEIIRVPRNLAVVIPQSVSFAEASTVTLGAIALQGVRRAQPTLGETFVVLGLGILGQLTAQILAANGCRVIGGDVDSGRVRQARELGMPMALDAEGGDNVGLVRRFTEGAGADGVIITAATSSDELVSEAFRMCRKKGRVVLVGDVGLDLDRNDIFLKELDFLVSTSYGPGRYDPAYEEGGLDYPIGYVRWTENRNMQAYLQLVADRRIVLDRLISEVRPVTEAPAAYTELGGEGQKPLVMLLSYPGSTAPAPLNRRVVTSAVRQGKSDRIRIAVAGAGGFAKAVHLPELKRQTDSYDIHAVMTRSGHNATQTAGQYGAAYATTDYEQILNDPDVDAVLIATRHDLHASMTLAALRTGKHVLVEKPLALTRAELTEIETYFKTAESGQVPVLLTGFNRRFSPFAERVIELTRGRTNPLIMNYRMNAGYIPLDHWTHGPSGGGRNLGEACHIYDLMTAFTGSPCRDVHARTITPHNEHYSRRDNFAATVTFADGSLATLTYTALGSSQYPKEQMELFCDGKVLALDDYRRLSVSGASARGLTPRTQQKGHAEELRAFAAAIRSGHWPIPLWQQIQAMDIAIRVEEAMDQSDVAE